jgi:tetratricopeptide (TPR) repeat protein
MRWTFGFTALLAVSVGAASSPSFAQAFETDFAQCRGSKEPAMKLQFCSMVIDKSKNRSQVERAYNSRGLANMALKDFFGAVRDFTKAMQMDPRNSGYVDNRQGAYFALGRFDLALTDANKAIQLSPREEFVYASRALIYSAMGQYSKALNDISFAITLNPKWTDLFIERGIIYLKSGQYELAVNDFNRTIELKGDIGRALKERGLTYMRMGNKEKAHSDLSTALQSRPDDEEIIAALQNFGPAFPEAKSQKHRELSGTGFFVAPHFVLTNNHVIRGCGSNVISVLYPDRKPEPAFISGQDDTNDLALLRTEAPNVSTATFRFAPRLGETVATYGFPFPGLLSSSGNFTLGNVTSLTGINDDTRLLQTSTAVQPGNSGGALLDMTGSRSGP